MKSLIYFKTFRKARKNAKTYDELAQKALHLSSPYGRNYGDKAGFSCPYSRKRLKVKK